VRWIALYKIKIFATYVLMLTTSLAHMNTTKISIPPDKNNPENRAASNKRLKNQKGTQNNTQINLAFLGLKRLFLSGLHRGKSVDVIAGNYPSVA